ncbi:MAG: protein phosphatase 2C domain-containing protein [Prevotella sp.]|nr:protein phosphatase 2C domain-containing protein [Prevotella sp.]
MQIEYSAFILPHIGDKYSQCADRFGYGETNKCFAIADGVGNSLFPGEWATLLCKDFIEHPMLFSDNSQLVREDELISKWEEIRSHKISNLTDDEKFIYEMGLEKADFAASTFVGLSLDEKGWACQAIGDSYLFVVDKSFEIIRKVASMDGRGFDNFPEYFGSKKEQNNGTLIRREGTYDNVAFFVLMTDALSDWFLETTIEKRKNLLSIRSHADFETFVDKERQQLLLKDDDTTIIVLKIKENGDKAISFCSNQGQVDDIDSLIAKENEGASSNITVDISNNDFMNEKPEMNPPQTIVKQDSKSVVSLNRITQEIDKISNGYHEYSKRHLKECVKELLSYIKQLTNGTSN